MKKLRLWLLVGLLGGSGGVSKWLLIRGLSRIAIWVIGVINLLTKSP